jgi:hypothetical protein
LALAAAGTAEAKSKKYPPFEKRLTMKLNSKLAAGSLAAIAPAMSSTSTLAQPTNFVLYNFDTD